MQNSDILNIGTGAASWWEVNGIGCRPLFGVNSTFGAVGIHPADLLRPPRPDLVEGCLLNYYFVEVIHAAVQLILAVIFKKLHVSLEDFQFFFLSTR